MSIFKSVFLSIARPYSQRVEARLPHFSSNPNKTGPSLFSFFYYEHSYSFIMRSFALFVFILGLLSLTLAIPPTLLSQNVTQCLHFTITRRGGKFAPTEFARDYVNLTYLAQELEKREDKFNLTKREIKGNKLVRKAKSNGLGGEEANALMGEVALDGIWSASSIYP